MWEFGPILILYLPGRWSTVNSVFKFVMAFFIVSCYKFQTFYLSACGFLIWFFLWVVLAFPDHICLRLICLIRHFKGQALGFADQIISGDGEIFSINFSFCLSISFRIVFVDFLTSSCPGTRFWISSPCCWGFAWRQQGSRLTKRKK